MTYSYNPWPDRVRNVVRGLGLLVAGCGVIGSILTIAFFLQGAPGGGSLHASFERTSESGQRHDIVKTIAADSPLAAQGIHAGDAILFDHAVDDSQLQRWMAVGEPVGLTILGPVPRHVTVAAVADPGNSKGFNSLIILDNCTSLLSIVIGGLILIRARRSNALLTLGLGFISFAIFSTLVPQNQAPLVFFWYTLSWTIVQSFVVTLAFVLFAILFYRENNGPVPKAVWMAFWVFAGAFAVATIGYVPLIMVNYALPGLGHATVYVLVLTECGFAAPIIGLIIGWRKSRQELQKRYAIMTVAIAMVIACDIMFAMQNLLFGGFGSEDYRAWYITAEWLSAAGHLLFAYAVLRDKVIDLGFVVNRAVVYGIISAMLLVAFGIIEWAVEHVIPVESLHATWLGQLVEPAIALGIYLLFHRVRDTVERFIEKLFFHTWHANEEALRRFVREADFVNAPDALLASFGGELTRFTSGAPCTLYLRSGDGFVARQAAGEVIDDNDAAVVALRARHNAVDPTTLPSSLQAALALPMSHRGVLFGFAALGPRPDGASYRPDEIDVLNWATHQIGLDYHALKVEALEAEAAALRAQNAALSGVIGKALSPAVA